MRCITKNELLRAYVGGVDNRNSGRLARLRKSAPPRFASSFVPDASWVDISRPISVADKRSEGSYLIHSHVVVQARSSLLLTSSVVYQATYLQQWHPQLSPPMSFLRHNPSKWACRTMASRKKRLHCKPSPRESACPASLSFPIMTNIARGCSRTWLAHFESLLAKASLRECELLIHACECETRLISCSLIRRSGHISVRDPEHPHTFWTVSCSYTSANGRHD